MRVLRAQAQAEAVDLGQRNAVTHATAYGARGVEAQAEQRRVGAAIIDVETAADPVYRVVGVGIAQADIAVGAAGVGVRGAVFAAAEDVVLRGRDAQDQVLGGRKARTDGDSA